MEEESDPENLAPKSVLPSIPYIIPQNKIIKHQLHGGETMWSAASLESYFGCKWKKVDTGSWASKLKVSTSTEF